MESVLVGMFDSPDAAEQARSKLLSAGFPDSAVEMTGGTTAPVRAAAVRGAASPAISSSWRCASTASRRLETSAAAAEARARYALGWSSRDGDERSVRMPRNTTASATFRTCVP